MRMCSEDNVRTFINEPLGHVHLRSGVGKLVFDSPMRQGDDIVGTFLFCSLHRFRNVLLVHQIHFRPLRVRAHIGPVSEVDKGKPYPSYGYYERVDFLVLFFIGRNACEKDSFGRPHAAVDFQSADKPC